MHFCKAGIIALILAMSPGAGAFSETVTYRYDALGRMGQSYRRDGPLAGLSTKLGFDGADNRQSYSAQNVVRVLHVGEWLYSPDGRFGLVMQGDGNLVLYQVGVAALWGSATFGSNYFAAFQSDGNLVVYTATGTPVWASNTDGYRGRELVLRNDGDMWIVDEGGNAIWGTQSCCH